VLAIAMLTMVALALPVAGASSAPKSPAGKPIEMVVESPQWAGVTDIAYTVTLTNKTGTQQLGAANVTVPTELTIVGEPAISRGNVTCTGRVLELRNLETPPDQSVTVTLGLRMPCEAGSYLWEVLAKQSNDFSGLPGNSLGPVSGTLSTTVQGTCKLRFVGQPGGTRTGELIRAAQFDEASTQLVSVEAIDGSPIDGSTPPSA